MIELPGISAMTLRKLFFPDETVKGSHMVEAEAAVEGKGKMVLFGDGEGEFAEATGGEVGVAIAQKMLANAIAAVFGESADLRDVANVVAHPGAEQDTDASAGGTMEGDERRTGVEDPAAGKPHDIVQKTKGAGDGAVLVIDIAVDVAVVGRGDDVGSRLIVGFSPTLNFDIGRKRAGWFGVRRLNGLGQEEPSIAAETFVYKRRDKVIGGMDEELSLDPMQAWGLLERADGVAEQLQLNAVAAITSDIGVLDEHIADHALGSLINEKAIAMDATALNGGEAGEDSGVSVTENQVGRAAVIPMESASPNGNFLVHESTEVCGSEMT
jgi:hypothetical protein